VNVRNFLKKEDDPVSIENKEEDDLCFMGQMKKAKNEVIFSDSDSDSYSDFKPTYKDLQDSIEEMHAESLNAFEKLIAQKKTILKLEYEISKKKHLSLKDEHALLVNIYIYIALESVLKVISNSQYRQLGTSVHSFLETQEYLKYQSWNRK